jgi:SPX domain protein involved in polyphosphate accumulation
MSAELQPQRFERKYFVLRRQALQIREFVRSYLVPDDYSVSENARDFAYPVHSLYLDSDQLATYWATVHCEKTRFKLRIRYYDDQPDSPVFFEIKRRVGDCILKQRGAVRRDAAPLIVAGYLPEPDHLLSSKPSHLGAVQKFSQLMQMMGARPKMHIAYEREAWVSPEGNSVRVTLDNNVRGVARHEPRFTTVMENEVYPFGKDLQNQIVLEIKFTNRFPDWLADLVRHFNLVASGAPKYCGSIALAGEERIGDGSPGEAQAASAVMRYF